jgi:hypothetical protein
MTEYNIINEHAPLNIDIHTDICAIPFVPKCEKECWHKAAIDDGHVNFRIRLLRAFFIVSTPLILLILATFKSLPVSFLIGIGLFFMFIIYFIIILRLIFLFGNQETATHHLYRIYSISAKPDEWAANLNIGYIQLLYKSHSIQSISELSAINGGVTKIMLNTLGAYTWISVAIHYAQELKWQNNFHWDASDIFVIIGSIGLLWISIFELDPFNKKMQFMHYLGAVCGCGTVIGYNLQQYALHRHTHFYFSIGVAIVCFISFALWQIIGAATELAQLPGQQTERGGERYGCICTPLAKLLIPNYRKIKVNTYSRLNIGFEALFLFLGSMSLCLFLVNYDNVCRFGCSASY